MKLIDLDPQFLILDHSRKPIYPGRTRRLYAPTLAEAQGIFFLCPCKHGHAVVCWFEDKVPDSELPSGRFRVSGTSFGDLTLDRPVYQVGECWIGRVTGGEVTDETEALRILHK